MVAGLMHLPSFHRPPAVSTHAAAGGSISFSKIPLAGLHVLWPVHLKTAFAGSPCLSCYNETKLHRRCSELRYAERSAIYCELQHISKTYLGYDIYSCGVLLSGFSVFLSPLKGRSSDDK